METNFGEFLKRKRQEKNLKQKDLAQMLFVSESAVSKWEKNVAHPDITLIPKLSKILGVTEHELITASVDESARAEKVQAKKWRALSLSWNLFFYISYAIALLVCFICNLAVSGTLSWFWIVFSALLLSFTFTNLPKLIKKHKLLFVPLSMFFALCVLLATCAIYTNGKWFWVASASVFFGMIIVFMPIYISKYNIFAKIKKYNDFVSVAIDFIVLNILLLIINCYAISSGYTNEFWFANIALPIVAVVYLVLNLLLSVRFLKISKLIKTSIVLFLIDLFVYMPPIFVKFRDDEINDINVFKANFLNWQTNVALENNIHCIVCLTILLLSVIFLVAGSICMKKKNNEKLN